MALSELPQKRAQAEAHEKIREKLAQKARKFQTVFDNRTGQEVLQSIKNEFSTNELTDHPDQTRIVVRAAQRDVVDYIERMVRHAGRVEDAGEE
jgi:hypothetical protein